MEIMEIWRDIEGYENLYQVSNLGRVKSLNYNKTGKVRVLKCGYGNGYLQVTLSKEGKKKQYLIHRLVAQAFISNPYNLPQVNHKDEDKYNNRVENLEWCSAKYNINYGTHTHRSAEKRGKKVLCVETGIIYPSTCEVERELGFYQSNISSVCLGKLKTCGGFHWRYIN